MHTERIDRRSHKEKKSLSLWNTLYLEWIICLQKCKGLYILIFRCYVFITDMQNPEYLEYI